MPLPDPRSPRLATADLSVTQERLWFLDQLEPGDTANHCSTTLELTGGLNQPLLEQCANEIVGRHEALRTRFVAEGGRPYQAIDAATRITIALVELSDVAHTDEHIRRMAEPSLRPFSIERGPLIRLTLFRRGPARHILQLAAHHIVWDAWSLGVFLDELLVLYDDFRVGRPGRLAPLRVQYREFAAAERAACDGPSAEQDLKYWRGRLEGLAPLELPTDRPRPRVPAFRPGSCSVSLPEELREAIQAFCAERRVSPFMLVLSALQVYLSFVSGQRDVAVGVPVANRARPEWDRLIGLFMNVLVFRCRLRDGESYAALLERVRDEALGAYAHGSYPFARLVAELNPARAGGATPLFQVMLVYLNAPAPALDLPGLSAALWYVEGVTARQDLTVTIGSRDDQFFASWEYNAELFDAHTVQRFAHQFARLLAVVAAGREPVPSVLVTPEEEARLLAWNATDRPRSGDATLRALCRLDRPADRVALVHDDVQVTFGALRSRVRALARRLVACGVGPDVRVGLLLSRSPGLIASMLAVWRAGGAYVPLDERWPRHRVEETAGTAGLDLLLVDGATRELGERLRVPMLDVDESESGSAAASVNLPETSPSNLAYVIFTSGSTGRPKGIEISRAAASNVLEAMASVLHVAETDVFLGVTTVSFDIALLEWALPLMAGGRVAVIDHDGARDPHDLQDAIARHRPTRMQATPSLWRLLIEAQWAGDETMDVLCGGEPLLDDLASPLRARCRTMWNLYGPTETTVWSMAARVLTSSPDLGSPLANTSVHLLDADRSPVPAGFDGELFIGGAGVARGYLRQPRLTAERFLPDPFGARPGARLYRTGDVARWDGDGRLRFRSRSDDQIKVRGFRVEPGDVEACLRSHRSVRDAVVRLLTQLDGQPLVAYLVLDETADEPPALRDLRRWARERLPEHMVPSRFVPVSTLPLTSAGKIDRAALPLPDALPESIERLEGSGLSLIGYEAQVAWRASLGCGRVAARDNFFDLGGNSLLAAQVSLTLTRALGVRVPVRLVFEAPVLEDFAARLAELRAGEPINALPRIEPDAERRFDPFPLTDVQEAYLLGRTGVFHLGEVSTYSYFEIDSARIDVGRFEAVWRMLIRRHDMLRAVFFTDGTQRVLQDVPPYTIRRVDACDVDDAARERLLISIREEMSHAVHAADEWPLFEIRATRLSATLTRFHIGLDALVADAFSSALLVREWAALYRDPDAELPAPAITFRDYVVALRALETTETYRRSERYWMERLDPSLRGPELPVRHHAVGAATRFVRRSARLDERDWLALRATALRLGLSPTTVVLTAFADVLAFWSRSPRFLLNLTLFNRLPLHPDVNGLVGDFTSITLLDVDARVPASFAAFAAAVQGRLWDDIDHRFFSGVRVLRELRRLSGAAPENLAPVVFTSTLGMDGGGDAAGEWGEEVFSISQTPQVWLDHKVYEDAGALCVDWDFPEALFPPGAIDAMFDAFTRALAALATREDVWQVDARGRHEALYDSTPVPVRVAPVAEPPTLHGLFLDRARRHPERLAVCASDRRVTYGELDAWSAASAADLIARGLRAEELVAVVAPKGWEQAVAVLAVLRAGGAYVPIGADEPDDRRLRMLQGAGTRFALTTPALAASLPWPHGCTPLVVAPRAHGSTPHEPEVTGDRLAYVIYTSGSTGRPKGVMIEHRSAVNTLRDLVDRLGLGPADRTLALSALSFDLSVFDLFGAWAAGGAIVYPDPARARMPHHWAELLEIEGITIWNSVPAQLEMLVETTPPRDSSVRWVLVSGDWIPVDLPPRVQRRWPRTRQLALGGATEASIWSILHPLEDLDPAWTRVPYGRAMVNQSVAVVNAALERLPTWVQGEIVIGGIGLARGYLNDPALTSERFVRDPTTGERLYRTGDLGCRLPNGEVEILGRLDQQVKVSGYRIECGEVEAVLQQQPGIGRAVVNLERDDAGHSALVAYLFEQPHIPLSSTIGEGALAAWSSKVAQPAIRRLPPDLARVPLRDGRSDEERRRAIARQSYRAFADAPATLDALSAWLSAVERRLDVEASARGGAWFKGLQQLEDVERVLALLKQDRVEGIPIPKLRYPSAGSLYPVQTYLGIPERSVDGLDAGTYYYDPRAHALVRLSSSARPPASPPHMMFVAELSAIEPTYGEASLRLCALEAGYMRGLFMDAPLAPVTLLDDVALSSSQRVLATFAWGVRPAPAVTAAMRLLIWVRPNGLLGIEPGCYAWDRDRGSIRQVADGSVDPAWFGPNRELVERSHFAVAAVAADGTLDSAVGAGVLGQVLMEESTRFDVGLCPIGEISHELLEAAQVSGSIAHGWIGGRVEPEQTRIWMAAPRRLDHDALVRRCRERAARHLPVYMHPARYLFLERLPLAANDKVNRAMLKHSLERDRPVDHGVGAAEGSEVERAVARMFEEVLQRPVTDLDRSILDMGASSIVLVRLHELVNARYPDRLSFQDYFDYPSVRGLARLIEGAPAAETPAATEVIEL